MAIRRRPGGGGGVRQILASERTGNAGVSPAWFLRQTRASLFASGASPPGPPWGWGRACGEAFAGLSCVLDLVGAHSRRFASAPPGLAKESSYTPGNAGVSPAWFLRQTRASLFASGASPPGPPWGWGRACGDAFAGLSCVLDLVGAPVRKVRLSPAVAQERIVVHPGRVCTTDLGKRTHRERGRFRCEVPPLRFSAEGSAIPPARRRARRPVARRPPTTAGGPGPC